jgi:hypothetical protein
MTMPNLSASASSGASGGRNDSNAGFGWDSGGFVVNYGAGVSTSAGAGAQSLVPWYVWAAVAVGAVLWAKRKR